MKNKNVSDQEQQEKLSPILSHPQNAIAPLASPSSTPLVSGVVASDTSVIRISSNAGATLSDFPPNASVGNNASAPS